MVAEAGDASAGETLVVVAHHDAPHGGLVFHPGPQRALAKRFPDAVERQNTSAPFWFPVIGGPLLVALGSLLGIKAITRLGVFLGLGTTALMVDIGRRAAVPGANDNLSAVAVLVALARSLSRTGPSTGCASSWSRRDRKVVPSGGNPGVRPPPLPGAPHWQRPGS